MTSFLLPDELTWRAGTEWGVMALAGARARGIEVECVITKQGPYLEAVGTAVHQLGLDDACRFADVKEMEASRIVLLPRVFPSGEGVNEWLDSGHVVISSDISVAFEHENLHRFLRRDVAGLIDLMLEAAGTD